MGTGVANALFKNSKVIAGNDTGMAASLDISFPGAEVVDCQFVMDRCNTYYPPIPQNIQWIANWDAMSLANLQNTDNVNAR